MEFLKGHGDGKNMRYEKNVYVKAFAFLCKCFAFPQETLRSFLLLWQTQIKYIHPQVVPNLNRFLSSAEHKTRHFKEC